ncbi:hypothetical protein [Bosea sp. (in: a-proteobacteria)]|uniref:hypothetical protein n=1 Tax=Bosea sp. (in: a-proteobacteria) TaxID=1871050 RepID=UPI0026328F21|nr:hypothetical protein [Bosea sp. (in: a-proteobacteria)]MCO5091996.1 hypothetical protein [Bosea sp. (in: a-proteobacteria)]
MEFAAAALSTIAGGISSAAGAVGSALGIGGTAGGAGGTLIGAGSVLATILSGTATVAGMMGARQAGSEQARSLYAQAADARTEQDIERIRGTERRDSLRRSLLATLGERDVAAAASGVDLSFGTPAVARKEAERDAESALVIDQSTEDMRIARLQERENEFVRSARSAKKAATINAVGLGLKGAASLANRYDFAPSTKKG